MLPIKIAIIVSFKTIPVAIPVRKILPLKIYLENLSVSQHLTGVYG